MRQIFILHKNCMNKVSSKSKKKKIGELQRGNSAIKLGEFETHVITLGR